MAKKKTDSKQKEKVTQLQGRFRKAGPMKHRLSKRVKQRQDRYDSQDGESSTAVP